MAEKSCLMGAWAQTCTLGDRGEGSAGGSRVPESGRQAAGRPRAELPEVQAAPLWLAQGSPLAWQLRGLLVLTAPRGPPWRKPEAEKEKSVPSCAEAPGERFSH